MLPRALCTVLLVLSAGCSARSNQPPPADPDPQRARAALATLYVQNETTHALVISYQIAGRMPARVSVGPVDPGSTAEMAPVPAGEPLILIARTVAGAEHTLRPRTFAIDSAWTWRIERSTRFTQPAPHQP